MSQSTSITEGGKGRPFGPVKALMVQGDDGKYYSWYPQSDKALGTLSVDKNGVYKASDMGVYGWGQVYVNVAQTDSVTGKDPDTGEEVVVRPDPETGEITETVVPVEIRVITPPTNPYGTYIDGQTITKDGMVVKAYSAKGEEMQIVPVGEITIKPTQAMYDESKDQHGKYTGDGITAQEYTSSAGPIEPGSIWYAFDPNFICTTPSLSVILTLYGNYVYAMSADGSSGFTSISIRSERISTGLSYDSKFIQSINMHQYEQAYSFIPRSTSDPEGKTLDDLTPVPAGSQQTITVSWPRPGDGAILETTFDILVGPRGGGGED